MKKYDITEVGKLQQEVGRLRGHLERIRERSSLKTAKVLYLERQLLLIRNHIDKLLKQGVKNG